MGTNLREPVPADPELTPKFTPIDRATPAERAAQSTALIKEAGLSAHQIGMPLTFQDFPDHPSMNSGTKKEDPMHASIPLFGLRAPRWRAKQGLDDHAIPGTAAYGGVVAPPVGGTGLRLYNNRARELKLPMWKLIEQGGDPRGIRVASSSSPGAETSNSPGVQGVPAGASLSNTRQIPVARGPTTPTTTSSTALSARPRPLYRTYAIANMEESISTSTSTSNIIPKPSALSRTSTMATIGSTRSTTSKTSTYSSLSTTLKRGRRTAELEDTADDMITDEKKEEEAAAAAAEPASKRRKRSVASDTGSESTTTTTLLGNRRSTRLTRASTAAPQPQPRPAPRGRATKGKKGQ